MLTTAIVGLFALGLLITVPSSFAHTETTQIIPINDELSLEKTITTMTVPEGNTLPWGFVWIY